MYAGDASDVLVDLYLKRGYNWSWRRVKGSDTGGSRVGDTLCGWAKLRSGWELDRVTGLRDLGK